jgi:lysophospholipase L1-like esterase
MLLYTIGDSFTYGVELGEPEKQAWPRLVADRLGYELVNLANPGASNDYIIRTTVEFLKTHSPDVAIIAWTTPHRLEINETQCTPNSHPDVFKTWDNNWAENKFQTQVKLLDKYLAMPHYFAVGWEDSLDIPCYIGRLVEWAYDAPRGLDGHPLEEGHKLIADEILKHI